MSMLQVARQGGAAKSVKSLEERSYLLVWCRKTDRLYRSPSEVVNGSGVVMFFAISICHVRKTVNVHHQFDRVAITNIHTCLRNRIYIYIYTQSSMEMLWPFILRSQAGNCLLFV